MTSVVRHLRALLHRQIRAFFAECIEDSDERADGWGRGDGSIQSSGRKCGASLHEWVNNDDLRWEEDRLARGGGLFYVCNPSGYMEDTI